MAFYDKIFENGMRGNIVGGLALGIGATFFAPMVLGALSSIARPLFKGAVKGGMVMYDKGKEVGSELFEKGRDVGSGVMQEMKDLASEARAELQGSQKKPSPPARSHRGR
jgi:hypothetical protein